MAKMFDVSTMNGSRLTLKTAGMESTAKATSVVSMTMRAMNSGVARRTDIAPADVAEHTRKLLAAMGK